MVLSKGQIFMCHASSDKPTVRQLYGRLLTDGFRVWLDEEDLLPGQDWQLEISKAISRSDLILVCLSSDSISKTGFVQREMLLTLDAADERPPGSIFIIPARLEECEIPDRFKRWHWVDLYKEDGYRKLRRSIETVLTLSDSRSGESPIQSDIGAPHSQPSGTVPDFNSKARFNGLYMRKTDNSSGGYWNYFRFFPSGVCYDVSSTGNSDQVARWLGSSGQDPIFGPFKVQDDKVDIVTQSSSGRVEYRGTISPSGTELRLHFKSYINGHESFGIWRFIEATFPNREEAN